MKDNLKPDIMTVVQHLKPKNESFLYLTYILTIFQVQNPKIFEPSIL